MESIVFLDRDTVMTGFRSPLISHRWTEYEATSEDEVIERLRGASVAITNKIPIRKAALAELPTLKLIVVAATGYDCVDVDECRARGIVVCNLRHYTRNSVPEHVMMLLLKLRRNFLGYQALVNKGEWQRAATFSLNRLPIHDLQGSLLGIIGYGVLGRSVEVLAKAFGMNVIIAEHKGASQVRPGRRAFGDVIRGCDAITLHCPLTTASRGMIGRYELAEMKSSSVLINCGRGGLVDESALVEALKAGVIAGAAVDVLSAEPPVNGNPLLDANLANLIVTPHNAWASVQAQESLTSQVVEIIESFFNGSPMNQV